MYIDDTLDTLISAVKFSIVFVLARYIVIVQISKTTFCQVRVFQYVLFLIILINISYPVIIRNEVFNMLVQCSMNLILMSRLNEFYLYSYS